MPPARRSWTRDELLAAFNLYCRTPFGRLHQTNPNIVALAKALRRTPGSVAMKLTNFASLDPAQQARGIKGLANAAAADRAIFTEFDQDWARLALESDAAMKRLGVSPSAPEPELTDDFIPPSGPTEVPRTVAVRRAQSLFRATVLASYDNKCAISGIGLPALLQASHIIPWSQDESRRLDPRNGIALSALHDRAFDRGLITIDEDLRVVVSKHLRMAKPPPIHKAALLDIEGRPIHLPTRYRPDPEALKYHREKVFVA